MTRSPARSAHRTSARRAWTVLAVLVLATLAGLAVAGLSGAPRRPLDPRSAAHDGGLALSRLLAADGITVRRSTSLAAVTGTVLVAFPNSYDIEQLRRLRADHRLVLLAPRTALLTALEPSLQVGDVDTDATTIAPGCTLPGPVATGPVRFPAGSYAMPGAPCYGGRISISERLSVLGSNRLLRNDVLADQGVAALAINTITAERTQREITWLLPGQDARGTGGATVWAVMPSWAARATAWLIVMGALAVVWRARRLGPVVVEPLPVVVRAAETVEGHGRLYRRAGARDRAADTLRDAARRRLARSLGLPEAAATDTVVAATPDHVDRVALRDLLAGPPPADDRELTSLALRLAELAGPPAELPGRPRGTTEGTSW